jgi:hypothetical protein
MAGKKERAVWKRSNPCEGMEVNRLCANNLVSYRYLYFTRYDEVGWLVGDRRALKTLSINEYAGDVNYSKSMKMNGYKDLINRRKRYG